MSSASSAGPLHAELFLLDLDGTLVDSRPDVERMWRQWCQKEDVDAEALLAVSEGRQGRSVVEEFAPHLDPRAEDAWIIRTQLETVRDVRPLPGVAEFLTSLGDRGWAIVTSCTRALATARLHACGLPEPPLMVPADEIEHGKPHPDGFLTAARRLEVPADRCLVFEDSHAGLEAARRAGMPAVAVTGATRDTPNATHVISDWRRVRATGGGPWTLHLS